ncbi:MAG: YncE family protein [Sphingomonadales bacterium]
MPTPLDAQISQPVRAAIEDIGRTEDLRFSPGGSLIALAGFKKRLCLIVRVAIEPDPDGARVTVDDFMVLSSPRLRGVHGVDFIDDRTLAVANREGWVTIFALPGGAPDGRHLRLEPVRVLRRAGPLSLLRSPGSVAVAREPDGAASLLVCNNYVDRVTRHVLEPGNGHRVRRSEVMLARGLCTPDGIALSPDGDWIAVSNHDSKEVALFRASDDLDRRAAPAGTLRGITYPHGLRFTPDGGHLLVADAGGPLVRVFARGNGWEGSRDPLRSIAVMDEDTYLRGRFDPTEGGPKGIDIDRTGSVVALTCREMRLAFFTLDSMVNAD